MPWMQLFEKNRKGTSLAHPLRPWNSGCSNPTTKSLVEHGATRHDMTIVMVDHTWHITSCKLCFFASGCWHSTKLLAFFPFKRMAFAWGTMMPRPMDTDGPWQSRNPQWIHRVCPLPTRIFTAMTTMKGFAGRLVSLKWNQSPYSSSPIVFLHGRPRFQGVSGTWSNSCCFWLTRTELGTARWHVFPRWGSLDFKKNAIPCLFLLHLLPTLAAVWTHARENARHNARENVRNIVR